MYVVLLSSCTYVPAAAEGNEGLNDTALPSFASYANSSAVTTRHDNLSCPAISGQYVAGRSVRLSLDPSYLGYVHCVCVEGMEVISGGGLWYRAACLVVNNIRLLRVAGGETFFSCYLAPR